ncbi:MAG TPA: hypothetical protein VGM76_09590, partial [Lacipirellulaceae bacterium]
MRRFATLLLITAAFCVIVSTAQAAPPSLSGTVTANFFYHPDIPEIPGDQSYWSWNGATGSLTLSIPSVIDTTINPSMIGPTPLNWSNSNNWTQPALDTSGVLIGQSGDGSFTATVNYGSATLDVFRGFGPREDAQT